MEEKPMRSISTRDLSSPIVLMVEDEPNLICLIRFYLEREGYQILAAADGREALDLVDRSSPADLAILDLMLPSMDGLQLARHIRNTPEWRRTPILVLTARSDERDVAHAYHSGANDFMTKPFHPRDLMDRVRRLLETRP
jgi:DNA-binding response OmpR family regulator